MPNSALSQSSQSESSIADRFFSRRWAAIHPEDSTETCSCKLSKALALFTILIFPAVKWVWPPLAVGWNATRSMIFGVLLNFSVIERLSRYWSWVISSGVPRQLRWSHLLQVQQYRCSSKSGDQGKGQSIAPQISGSPYYIVYHCRVYDWSNKHTCNKCLDVSQKYLMVR